jgi:hypothetical protein
MGAKTEGPMPESRPTVLLGLGRSSGGAGIAPKETYTTCDLDEPAGEVYHVVRR